MEEQIKTITKTLQAWFAALWGLPILLITASETDLMPVGVYADDIRMQYIWETVCILVTLVTVPVSLKLFNFILTKRVDESGLPQAMKLYVRWSVLRYCLLIVTILLGLTVYYMTLHNVGVLCAAIALTTSLFCVPGEKRVTAELQL